MNYDIRIKVSITRSPLANFEIQKYFENKQTQKRFNGVYSKNKSFKNNEDWDIDYKIWCAIKARS